MYLPSIPPSLPPSPPGEDSGEFMGSYYVLEVGNFDLSPTRPESQEAVPAGEGGYFLLNTDDPSLSIANEEGEMYSQVPPSGSRQAQSYENTTPLLRQQQGVASPKKVKPVGSKLHPHLVMANEAELERVGQAGCPRVKSEGRASTYENVCPPGEREVVPVPAGAVGGVASPQGEGPLVRATVEKDSRATYENVELRPHPPQLNSAHNHGAGAGVRRSAQQRKEVYEEVPLRGQKVNGIGAGSVQNNCRSPETGTYVCVYACIV